MKKQYITILSKSFGRIDETVFRKLKNIGEFKFINLYNKKLNNLSKTNLNYIKKSNIIIGSAKHIPEQLLYSKNLSLIAIKGVGYHQMNLDIATKNNVYIIYNPGINSTSVSEFVIGLIISLCRNISKADSEIRTGNWQRLNNIGTNITGKNLGIIGFGNIGKKVAKKAYHLGMNILINTRTIKKNDELISQKINGQFVDLNELLINSDIISLHVPLTEKTFNLINIEKLKLMKDSAYIINTSRGEVLNKNDLVKCLNSGIISGAALDVYNQEPLATNDSIRQLENTVLTPHLASYTKETLKEMDLKITEHIVNFANGSIPPKSIIANKDILQNDNI
jgi:phosphoglycerate dehydrogenase-like enzyme